ncbi:MAG: site-2 protease family protein [Phycisphaerae bacterium]|jgi:regulator of sigma E protease
MSESKRLKSYRRIFMWLVILGLAIYLIAGNFAVFRNILIIVIGFGAMIFVHELGHFTAAKLSRIKVEAFSIGMGPIVIGVMRTEKGYRVRILPGADKENGEPGEGGLQFTLGRKAKPGDTEYRISLIPFGGFVKMLGQDDIVQTEKSNDPRSFANKSVGARFAVIASGVLFNVLSAMIFFMIAFMVGIDFPPAIVGGVVEGSAADKAGLVAGDEIIEIDGRSKNLDFQDILFAAVLSDWAEQVSFKVKHSDGTVEQVYMAATKLGGETDKRFGIQTPFSLSIQDVTDPNQLAKDTGLRPGDRIISVNGQDIEHFWQMEEIINKSYSRSVSMLAERKGPGEQGTELVKAEIPLTWPPETVNGLANVCSIVPRLKVYSVSQPTAGLAERLIFKLQTALAKAGVGEKPVKYELELEPNDIIISAGDVNYPTYHELRQVTQDNEGKNIPMTVLRENQAGVLEPVGITVRPSRQQERVVIGFIPVLDVEHAVAAKTVRIEDINGLDIPTGATITSVDETNVSDFLEIAKHVSQNANEKITFEYISTNGEKGSASANSADEKKPVMLEPSLAKFIPFAPMIITHKAASPVEAVSMGFNKTVRMIAMTYESFKVLLSGQAGGEGLRGPVGIIQISYQVVSSEPLIYYVYLIGFLSVAIAVFNFLPMLPLDGGWALFLLIEKIKGSPVNPKIITAAAGFGWILIGALFIFITFNDITRWFGTLF